MRCPKPLVGVVIIAALTLPAAAQDHHSQLPPKILSAKTAYFEDRTGAPPVGKKALERFQKWGRFQVVQHREQADLIILLSADPYKKGQIATAGGQTGTVGRNGQIDVDPVPNFNKLAPVRYAYLTVIDPATDQSLWDDSHQWGGLLTGFNSVGERLVKKLERQMK